MSENNVYNLISQGALSHVRYGKLIRIPGWALLQDMAAAAGAPLPLNLEVALSPAQSVYVDQQGDGEDNDG